MKKILFWVMLSALASLNVMLIAVTFELNERVLNIQIEINEIKENRIKNNKSVYEKIHQSIINNHKVNFESAIALLDIQKNNEEISNLFLTAVANGRIDMVMDLLKVGANINFIDTSNGYTAMHIAAYDGNLPLVNNLINYDQEINLLHKNDLGMTALQMAESRHGQNGFDNSKVINVLKEK